MVCGWLLLLGLRGQKIENTNGVLKIALRKVLGEVELGEMERAGMQRDIFSVCFVQSPLTVRSISDGNG